jgi:hypothetical protein
MNLSSARVFVRDLAEAARFYGEKLGFTQSAGGIEHGACIYMRPVACSSSWKP